MTNKKRKIRALALLLAACLLSAGVPCFAENHPAQSELFGPRLIDADDSIRSVALVNDTVYILTRRAFYVADAERRSARFICGATDLHESRPGMPPAVGMLFEQAGELLGFNPLTGTMYTLTVGENEVVFSEKLTLDMTPFLTDDSRDAHVREAERGILAGGKLYLKMPSYQRVENDLFRIDLATKETEALGATYLQGLVPYKDGKLIGVRNSPDLVRKHPDGYEISVVELAEFDPETREVSALPYALPQNGISLATPVLYDAETDSVYIADDTRLLRLDAEPKAVAVLPGFLYSNMKTQEMTRLKDGLLIAADAHAFFRRPEERLSAVELKIYGNRIDKKTAARALMSMDGVTVTYIEPSGDTAADVSARLVSRTLDADILLLSSDAHDIRSMAKKGYLKELTDAADIQAYARKMNPMFEALMYEENRLFGVPILLDLNSMTANVNILGRLGAKAPSTFRELLALIEKWNDEWYDMHVDLSLIEQPRIKKLLKELALDWYIDAKISNAESPLFSGDEITDFFALIDDLDVSAFDVDAPNVDETDMAFLLEGATPILEIGMSYSLKNAAGGGAFSVPVIVSPVPEYPGKARAAATVMSISAQSSKTELAERFVSLYLQNMDKVEQAALGANASEPIANPHYEQALADRKMYLDRLNAELSALEGAERRAVEADLAYLTGLYEEAKINERDLITVEQLRQHAEAMKNVYVDNSLTLVQNRLINENRHLRDMLLSGALDARGYADQMNARLKLAEMESR